MASSSTGVPGLGVEPLEDREAGWSALTWTGWLLAGVVAGLVAGFAIGLARPRPRYAPGGAT